MGVGDARRCLLAADKGMQIQRKAVEQPSETRDCALPIYAAWLGVRGIVAPCDPINCRLTIDSLLLMTCL
jgi:hypothetical protein